MSPRNEDDKDPFREGLIFFFSFFITCSAVSSSEWVQDSSALKHPPRSRAPLLPLCGMSTETHVSKSFGSASESLLSGISVLREVWNVMTNTAHQEGERWDWSAALYVFVRVRNVAGY